MKENDEMKYIKFKKSLKRGNDLSKTKISWSNNSDWTEILDEFSFNRVLLNEIFTGAPKVEVLLKNESSLELTISYTTTEKFKRENLDELENEIKEHGVLKACEDACGSGILRKENSFCTLENLPESVNELADLVDVCPKTVKKAAEMLNLPAFKKTFKKGKIDGLQLLTDATIVGVEAMALVRIATSASSPVEKVLTVLGTAAAGAVAIMVVNEMSR